MGSNNPTQSSVDTTAPALPHQPLPALPLSVHTEDWWVGAAECLEGCVGYSLLLLGQAKRDGSSWEVGETARRRMCLGGLGAVQDHSRKQRRGRLS